jgi:putative endonuclease
MTKSGDGAAAERIAEAFLQARGLKLIERNYRCRTGEIDLILEHRGTLVFVEVRLRRSGDFGGAAASVTHAKQARILRAARHYLAGRPEPRCRFDVVLLDRLASESVEWIEDAFGE